MKKIIYFALLLMSFSLYAQPSGGRNGGRQNQNQQGNDNKEPKEFKASEVAGIFYYDVSKVLKKLKIKDEAAKDSTSKALKDYNFHIKQISFLNKDRFIGLNEIVNTAMKARRSSNNNSSNNNNSKRNRGGVREKVEEIIRPIRQQVRERELELNSVLAAVLTEKQNKKWLKYQKKIKDKLKPEKQARNNNNQNQNQRGNRQRGGF